MSKAHLNSSNDYNRSLRYKISTNIYLFLSLPTRRQRTRVAHCTCILEVRPTILTSTGSLNPPVNHLQYWIYGGTRNRITIFWIFTMAFLIYLASQIWSRTRWGYGVQNDTARTIILPRDQQECLDSPTRMHIRQRRHHVLWSSHSRKRYPWSTSARSTRRNANC